MFRLVNVNKEYKISNGVINALKDININFPDSGFYSVIGKSGAGKTTLLDCLARINNVSSGEIYFNNIDICKLKGIELDNYRENVAFIFQEYNLLKEYTVEQNIALSLHVQGLPKEEIHNIVNDVLEKVGLSGYNKRKIIEISGGEQQRVVIARALAKKSKVIFCDEPTGNLDEITSRNFFNLLKEISKDILVINVTHNKKLANEYSDGIIEIEKGKVVKNTIEDNNISNNIDNKIKNKKNSFRFISKLCIEHYKKMFILSLIMLIVFICTFSIFTIFKSIYDFKPSTALISTLKNNKQTVLQITNYKEYCERIEYEEGYDYEYGLEQNYKEITKEELEKLQNDLSGKAQVYNSYYYLKSFDSLFGIEYPYKDKWESTFHYNSFYFEKIIAVKDFSNFSMPLIYGSNPKEENEILIYDYMANNLIYHKAFDCEMKDLIGKKIYDKEQDLELKIAGIIKSNYQDYKYTDNYWDFIEIYGTIYLSGLRAIYASESLVNKLKNNISITGIEVIKRIDHSYIDEDGNYVINRNIDFDKTMDYRKLSVLDNTDFEFIGKSDWDDDGLILTLSQVSEIMGLDRLATIEEVDSCINPSNHDYEIDISIYYYKYGISTLDDVGYREWEYFDILGVVPDDTFSDPDALHIYEEFNDYSNNISPDGTETSQYFIAFNNDYSYADEVIDYLKYSYHDDLYYEECIKDNIFYCNEGFCIYDEINEIVIESEEYLKDFEKIIKTALIISIILMVIGIIGLCLLSITKQTYKIGILKSLGTKNYQIKLSYILFVSILVFLSYIISIPISYFIIDELNWDFSWILYLSDLLMFSVSKISLINTFVFAMVISLLGAFITYLIFTINPPVMLIRENKDR